jgi:hypothetical protein
MMDRPHGHLWSQFRSQSSPSDRHDGTRTRVRWMDARRDPARVDPGSRVGHHGAGRRRNCAGRIGGRGGDVIGAHPGRAPPLVATR